MSGTVGEVAPSLDEDRVAAMLGLNDEQDTAPDESAPEAEQPEEGAAPSEQDDQPEGDQQAVAVEPPAFWSADAKAHWAAIPAETQEYIAHRESERDAAVQRAQNEAAGVRNQAAQMAQQLAAERAYLTEQLAPAIQDVTKRLQGDYSPERLAELSKTDPVKYVEALGERDRLASLNQAMQAEAERSRQLALLGEMQTLTQKAPELQDPAKAGSSMNSWVHLAGEFGYTPQEMQTVADHRAFLVLRELATLRAEKTAREAAIRKVAQPASNRPVNVSRPRPDAAGQRAMSRSQVMNAAKSGSVSEQEAAMSQLLQRMGI